MNEPQHEESDDCWCLPHILPVETEDGTINYVIVHNRITDEVNNQGESNDR